MTIGDTVLDYVSIGQGAAISVLMHYGIDPIRAVEWFRSYLVLDTFKDDGTEFVKISYCFHVLGVQKNFYVVHVMLSRKVDEDGQWGPAFAVSLDEESITERTELQAHFNFTGGIIKVTEFRKFPYTEAVSPKDLLTQVKEACDAQFFYPLLSLVGKGKQVALVFEWLPRLVFIRRDDDGEGFIADGSFKDELKGETLSELIYKIRKKLIEIEENKFHSRSHDLGFQMVTRKVD